MIYICTYISSFYLSVILPHVPSILLYVVLNYTVLYFTILNYTIRYYTILYDTILYYTKLQYTKLYYTILYYTILKFIFTVLRVFYFILYILSSVFHCSFQIHQSNLLISFFITHSIFIYSLFSLSLDFLSNCGQSKKTEKRENK